MTAGLTVHNETDPAECPYHSLPGITGRWEIDSDGYLSHDHSRLAHGPIVQRCDAALYRVPDIFPCLIHGISLGVTAGEGESTDHVPAILGVLLDHDFIFLMSSPIRASPLRSGTERESGGGVHDRITSHGERIDLSHQVFCRKENGAPGPYPAVPAPGAIRASAEGCDGFKAGAARLRPLFDRQIGALETELAALQAYLRERLAAIVREIGFACDCCKRCCTR